MNAAARVLDYLEAHGVTAALIGGIALSAHGIARATLDADILVADPVVLDQAFWAEGPGPTSPEIRRGDPDDPLLGLVRFDFADTPVDVIVGRGAWIGQILARRLSITVTGRPLPVVDRADLVLLKLFARGPQDLLDVRLLLAAASATLRRQVEERLPQVPASVREAWQELTTSDS
jgi:hypothetical protein